VEPNVTVAPFEVLVKSSRNNRPGRKQPTPQELLTELSDFLQRKFYEGRAVEFAKDRRRLLDWVILWPARWLDKRGVTIPADRYREIFMAVFMDGLRFGNTGNITYLPAWLAKLIQSHFEHHGDQIYAEAKSMRTMVEHAVLVTGKLAQNPAPDPIRELAQAARLLASNKRVRIAPIKDQLTLL
jgi:hypothetical protein